MICPADAHQIHTNARAGEQGTRDAVISKGSGSTKKKCEGGNEAAMKMKGVTKMKKAIGRPRRLCQPSTPPASVVCPAHAHQTHEHTDERTRERGRGGGRDQREEDRTRSRRRLYKGAMKRRRRDVNSRSCDQVHPPANVVCPAHAHQTREHMDERTRSQRSTPARRRKKKENSDEEGIRR